MCFVDELRLYLDSGHSGLLVTTSEYTRLEREIILATRKVTKKGKVTDKPIRRVFFWNAAEGMIDAQTEQSIAGEDPLEAIQKAASLPLEHDDVPVLVVLKDFHHWFESAEVLANLQVLLISYKQLGSAVLFMTCKTDLPDEIKNDVTVLQYKLPSQEVLRKSLDGIVDSAKESSPSFKVTDEGVEEVLQAGKGMSTTEFENALSKSFIDKGEFSVKEVTKEKMRALAREGTLQYYEAKESMESVGGMGQLKEWLRKRKKAFSQKAKSYGLQSPRGVLFLGVPGGGKSLCAKALSNAWQLPLLRFDVGSVFGSLVGESEARMREVQERAEALAPIILWIDELEKAFAGSSSGESLDSGTTARVFGSFLTWLQEKSAEVFVVATSNDVTALPPEFLRKGRFDEIFFVDLPNSEEREEIFKIHLTKRDRDPGNFDLKRLVTKTSNFTGAEIEECIKEAMFDAFDDNTREVEDADILHAAGATTPLSTLMAEQIAHLRSWAKGRARSASEPEKKKRAKPKRKLGGLGHSNN